MILNLPKRKINLLQNVWPHPCSACKLMDWIASESIIGRWVMLLRLSGLNATTFCTLACKPKHVHEILYIYILYMCTVTLIHTWNIPSMFFSSSQHSPCKSSMVYYIISRIFSVEKCIVVSSAPESSSQHLKISFTLRYKERTVKISC